MSVIEALPREIPIPPHQVRPQNLIITLFGLYRRSAGTAMPVAALVGLLGDLGCDEPGVRSAVSRLKSKGILKSSPVNGVAAYDLSESVKATFDEGDQRIFAEDPHRELNDWALVLFSVPESMRHLRHQVRKNLRDLGFGIVASGVSIGAGQLLDQARERLARNGLTEYVQFFRGEYFFSGDVRSQVAQWWDLDAVDASLQQFLEFYENAVELWSHRLIDEPDAAEGAESALTRQAFQYYVPMLTMWRRLPYQDPNLPQQYLPIGWKEPAARAAFVGTHHRIGSLASGYVAQRVADYLPSDR